PKANQGKEGEILARSERGHSQGFSVASMTRSKPMEPSQQRTKRWLLAAGGGITLVILLAGCVGVPTAGEKRARLDRQAVERTYRPGGQRPTLPKLGTNSPLSEFLLFAVLNQPQVEAAYFDWAASVERITRERSLPDPRLTFQSDIADVAM